MAKSMAAEITIAGIKAALTAVGAITAVNYENTEYLIFTGDCFPGVVKIQRNSNVNILVYYGDAWTTGSTITNQAVVAVQNSSGSEAATKFGVCRIAGKILAINWNFISSAHTGTAIFGYLTTTDAYFLGLNTKNYTNTNATGFKNITTGVASDPIVPWHTGGGNLLTAGGNFLRANVDRAENSLVVADNLQNLKILCRPSTVSDVCIASGDHVIVTGGGANNNQVYMGYDMVVIDGNL